MEKYLGKHGKILEILGSLFVNTNETEIEGVFRLLRLIYTEQKQIL